jgi:hypothetical protein
VTNEILVQRNIITNSFYRKLWSEQLFSNTCTFVSRTVLIVFRLKRGTGIPKMEILKAVIAKDLDQF